MGVNFNNHIEKHMSKQEELMETRSKENSSEFRFEKCSYTGRYSYIEYINGVSTGVQVMTQEHANVAILSGAYND